MYKSSKLSTFSKEQHLQVQQRPQGKDVDITYKYTTHRKSGMFDFQVKLMKDVKRLRHRDLISRQYGVYVEACSNNLI